MHIILAILGSVISILFYINMIQRSGGVRLPDPFAWHRKRSWFKKHTGDPVMTITSPMEATALLMYAMAKCSGDVSKDQKSRLVHIFKSDFNFSEKQAVEMLSSCSFLLPDEDKIVGNLEKFLVKSASGFNDEQKESAIALVKDIAHCEGNPTQKQLELLQNLENYFYPPVEQRKKWS